MASPGQRRRKHSSDHPPNMEAIASLRDQTTSLNQLVDSSISELQAQINTLKEITNRVEDIHEKATVGSFTGGVAGAAGGIVAVAGFARSLFTRDASLVAAEIGTAAAVPGGVTSAASNIINLIHQKVSRDDIEKALKTFKAKLSPITARLEDIQLSMKKLLLLATSGLLFAAAGLQFFDMIDDVAAMAGAQVSNSLRIAAPLPGVFAGVTDALDIFYVDNDAKELMRIKEGSTGSSETMKFITEMKETIKTMKQIVDSIKDTNENLKCLSDRLRTLNMSAGNDL